MACLIFHRDSVLAAANTLLPTVGEHRRALKLNLPHRQPFLKSRYHPLLDPKHLVRTFRVHYRISPTFIATQKPVKQRDRPLLTEPFCIARSMGLAISVMP